MKPSFDDAYTEARAINYCNRTLIGQVTVENVVTCFFSETQCRRRRSCANLIYCL